MCELQDILEVHCDEQEEKLLVPSYKYGIYLQILVARTWIDMICKLSLIHPKDNNLLSA